jgi:hypothetical protein
MGSDEVPPGGADHLSTPPVLERLAQHFHGIASELGQLIQEQDAVVPTVFGNVTRHAFGWCSGRGTVIDLAVYWPWENRT